MADADAPKKARYLPDLKKYIEKRVLVRMGTKRSVEGTLRGFDDRNNLVLEDAEEINEKTSARTPIGTAVVRGNAVQNLEILQSVA